MLSLFYLKKVQLTASLILYQNIVIFEEISDLVSSVIQKDLER